jgi:TPR repeat protein
MSDIFISYSTQDGSPEANELVAALEANGWRCWIAPRDMKPGVEYPAQIVKAIRECHGFVLMLTPGTNVSRDVLQEVTTAHNADKLIVPLIVRGTRPSDGLHYFLVARQHVAWTDTSAAVAALGKVFASAGGAAAARRPAELQGDTVQPADRGNAEEQNTLGVMYRDGDGVTQSDTEAVKWFRLGADQGSAAAQTNLGFMYETGRGVTQSNTEAAKWFRLAADQGFALAQSNLGAMYHNGRGVPQHHAEALKWYRLAADQGNAPGRVNLGVMYEHGNGVPASYTEAVKWYRLAADQGDAGGQKNLGTMYEHGLGVLKDLTEAVKWYRLAAKQGDQDAQKRLQVLDQTNS